MALKFKGVDFIGFDALLSDDERLVRDTARRFIEENLIPIIEQCNRDGRFPRELVKPMGELGFYGATLKGYGCAEMNNVEYGKCVPTTVIDWLSLPVWVVSTSWLPVLLTR